MADQTSTAEPMRGVLANIYRSAVLGECSNRGISSQVDTVTVVGVAEEDRVTGRMVITEPVEGPFVPRPDAPAVVLVRRSVAGREVVHAEPWGDARVDGWYMAGGTFIVGDSRVTDAAGIYGAIALHDRQER